MPMRFEFHDAAGNVHCFTSYEDAEAFALACGYVFVTSRRLSEGSEKRISYFLSSDDVPAGFTERSELFSVLLEKYPEWQEPRIMPVEADDGKESKNSDRTL